MDEAPLRAELVSKSANLNIWFFSEIFQRQQGILSQVVIQILGSIVVSIPACHAGDRGSILRRGELNSFD